MAAETSESTVHLRRCAINGCAWRGTCPDHDVEDELDPELNRLMRLRPFGAGRKHQRSAAKYAQSYRIKSKVTVTTVEERRKNPPAPVRRKRHIVHPDTFAAVRELTASLRLHRTGSNTSSPLSDVTSPLEAPDTVSPGIEPVVAEVREASQPNAAVPFSAPAKPSPALLANLRRPVPEMSRPARSGPRPRVSPERTSPVFALAGSSSSAALGPAIEAMRKARRQSRPERS
ncbi:hypothetical protein [Amycolatopsis decaplanina]|uniref:Uncharacterized protein n=1 Tax=Amycolatopsis decaplanina DSM 44594 TaxID=1284240 RepID=M2Y0D1_9PSEU|nr:hypothetical protein [Amycolatopsis decaplanina]EME54985.1 hypothetical protein H074_25792 [Amycolatopsis decaplanina DSM 44594]